MTNTTHTHTPFKQNNEHIHIFIRNIKLLKRPEIQTTKK